MTRSIIFGLRTGAGQWRIILIMYCVQLLLAIPLAFQIFQVLDASIGNSLEVEKLIYDYNNTIFSDFINHHGASISPLIGQLRWALVMYFLLGIFFYGGILECIQKNSSNWLSFWKGCARNFWSFLRLALMLMVAHLIWFGVLILPALIYFQKLVGFFKSEQQYAWLFFGLVAVYLIGLFALLSISLMAKVVLVERGHFSAWRAFRTSLGWMRKRFTVSVGIYAIFAATYFLILWGYVSFDMIVGMISEAMIVIFFFLQQLLILCRHMIRVMTAASFWKEYQLLR